MKFIPRKFFLVNIALHKDKLSKQTLCEAHFLMSNTHCSFKLHVDLLITFDP